MAHNDQPQLSLLMTQEVSDAQFDLTTLPGVKQRARRRGRVRAAFAGAAIAGALASAVAAAVVLSGSGGQPPVAQPSTAGVELPLMTQSSSGGAHPAALMHGTLVLDEASCLSVRIGPPDERVHPVVWPHEWRSVVNPVTGRAELVDADGAVVAVEGAEISVGGGLSSDTTVQVWSEHPCQPQSPPWYASPDVDGNP